MSLLAATVLPLSACSAEPDNGPLFVSDGGPNGGSAGSGARAGNGGSGAAGNVGGSGSGNGGASGSGGGSGSASGGSSSGTGGASGSGSGGMSGSGGSSGSVGSGGVSGGTGGAGGSGGGVGSCGTSQTYNSKATHYTLATPLVHCSYPTDSLPQYYAALNEADYADAAMCGACMRVTGPRGSVDVQIVDECPYIGNEQWCWAGSHHVDLNQAAFSRVGDLNAGVIDISWQVIPCSVQGNLSFTFKEGSSIYWSAVMVRNHRYRITKLEYRNNSSGYKELRRQDYNYWLDESGFGEGPYSFRITDVHGSVVEQTGIASLPQGAIGAPQTVQGSVQLPQCQ